MANKFTKSVLERQAKEYRAQSAGGEHELPAPQVLQAPAQPEEPAAVQSAPAPAVFVPPADESYLAGQEHRPAKKARAMPDLSDFIVHTEGRSAKNKTFYLDAAVIEGIHRAAAAQRITDSKLVNDILRKILDL